MRACVFALAGTGGAKETRRTAARIGKMVRQKNQKSSSKHVIIYLLAHYCAPVAAAPAECFNLREQSTNVSAFTRAAWIAYGEKGKPAVIRSIDSIWPEISSLRIQLNGFRLLDATTAAAGSQKSDAETSEIAADCVAGAQCARLFDCGSDSIARSSESKISIFIEPLYARIRTALVYK